MNTSFSPALVLQILEDCSQLSLPEVKRLFYTRFSYTLLFLNDLKQLEEIYQLIQLIHKNIAEEKKEQQHWAELSKKVTRLNIKLKSPLYRLLTPKRERQILAQIRTKYQAEIRDIAAKHSLENFSQSSSNKICLLVDKLEAFFEIHNPLGGASKVFFSINPHKLQEQVIYKIVQDFFE
ncbi:hypothetical protein BKI52_44185 [marine bacterium AO1-C]|nr:hypothetical protein BKI52_44185 [marine bacterium AO1-C]